MGLLKGQWSSHKQNALQIQQAEFVQHKMRGKGFVVFGWAKTNVRADEMITPNVKCTSRFCNMFVLWQGRHLDTRVASNSEDRQHMGKELALQYCTKGRKGRRRTEQKIYAIV
jgi:hypothetical protein